MEELDRVNIHGHLKDIRHNLYHAIPFELDRIAFDVLWNNPFISRIRGGQIKEQDYELWKN